MHVRDPYNLEGHLQVLHYYTSRWHGSHGSMYDFAHHAAGVALPGSPLPVLMQYARVEEYRCILDRGKGQQSALFGIGQHWDHDGAVRDVRRTWERWIAARVDGPVVPAEVQALNSLAHAACHAGHLDLASVLFRMLGNRATRTPWSCTGDPEKQFIKWRKESLRGE
ncbi:hypothetical protein HRW19_06745 [Streptomyces lunaelactis]|nr:hypothetical protein [Streptomyces lunaelactis]